ncbi:DUF2905 domain-containing protein [bacterium]|nr:DUF2905 domain-containing protein [bacterium]
MNILGRILVIFGIVLILVGLIITSGIKIPYLGRLPGDICIKRPNFTFYFPLTTCILLSIILSLIFWFLERK